MHSRGSSLVESLVAMSIFSIGTAATGAWFAQSLAADAQVSRVLAADAMASSLAARMRYNRAGVAGGHYTVSVDASSCVHACDAAALASDDMRRFREALTTHLGPAADGRVQCDVAEACDIRMTRQGREVLAWRVRL
jgi:Tfp pilus assembly protein PilV